MRIVEISKRGIKTPKAYAVNGSRGGAYFALTHGAEGRGRWQLRMPLAAREFPVQTDRDEVPSITMEGDFKLVDLKRKDTEGNPVFLLAKGEDDGKQLVLLSLSPGHRGTASYQITGQGEVLGRGYEAQGMAGRAGGAACPLVLVSGPCQITWHRKGNLYGEAADWAASWDGKEWAVGSALECAAEDAAFKY